MAALRKKATITRTTAAKVRASAPEVSALAKRRDCERAARSVQERDTHQESRGRGTGEHQVLERCLGALRPPEGEQHQHIHRQGHQLEPEEKGEEDCPRTADMQHAVERSEDQEMEPAMLRTRRGRAAAPAPRARARLPSRAMRRGRRSTVLQTAPRRIRRRPATPRPRRPRSARAATTWLNRAACSKRSRCRSAATMPASNRCSGSIAVRTVCQLIALRAVRNRPVPRARCGQAPGIASPRAPSSHRLVRKQTQRRRPRRRWRRGSPSPEGSGRRGAGGAPCRRRTGSAVRTSSMYSAPSTTPATALTLRTSG